MVQISHTNLKLPLSKKSRLSKSKRKDTKRKAAYKSKLDGLLGIRQRESLQEPSKSDATRKSGEKSPFKSEISVNEDKDQSKKMEDLG